jgi:hypothetical protein
MKLTEVLGRGLAALLAFAVVGVIAEAILIFSVALYAGSIHQTVDANWTLIVSSLLGLIAAVLTAIGLPKILNAMDA